MQITNSSIKKCLITIIYQFVEMGGKMMKFPEDDKFFFYSLKCDRVEISDLLKQNRSIYLQFKYEKKNVLSF